jgi:hypothetical protein
VNDAAIKKSPFRALLEQARDLGIKRLRFDVDLEGYNEEDDVKRWEAWVPYLPGAATFPGSSGQLVLTELIADTRLTIEQKARKEQADVLKKK